MISAAIVGLGWWGRKLTQSIAGSQFLRIVKGVQLNQAGVADFAASCGFPIVADLDAALADPAVQAVILATPHALHDEQIARAAKAGKHIFCEKPLSLTGKGAAASVELCRSNKLVLGIGHERRYEPPVAQMIADARGGAFGVLLQFEGNFSHDKFTALAAGNWRMSDKNAPAGGMTATGIHLCDIATALFGEAAEVFASSATLASSIANGDSAAALIRYKSGATAYVSAMLATPFVSRLALFGSEDWIEIRDKAHVESPDGWIVTRCKKGGDPVVSEVPVAQPVRANLEAFARAIEGSAPYPITGEEMIRNAAVMEAIFKSAASRKLEAVTR